MPSRRGRSGFAASISGFDHPFAAVLIAWVPDLNHLYVIDSFSMTKSSAMYHVQRIHSMTQGLRVKIAYPHDGSVHDKGSGLSLAGQYKSYGANMADKWALNHGTTNYNVEPALEEIRTMMYEARLTIAPHNYELIEEMRNYHYDENFKIVKVRDDLVSAFRYAVMERRQGRPQTEYDGVGRSFSGGNMLFAGQQRERPQANGGLARNVDFDVF
jgi:hypothetical protein